MGGGIVAFLRDHLVGIIAFLRDLFLLASLLASGTFLVGLSFHQGPLLVGSGTPTCAQRHHGLPACACREKKIAKNTKNNKKNY